MATATKDVSLNKKVSQFFWRSWAIQASWNYERQMNMGFLYGMVPTLDRLYPDESDPKQLAAKKEAYHRHMAFYNCTPQTKRFHPGLAASMEEEYAKDPENFNPDSINAVKTSLMGPLSGIGDSFFQAPSALRLWAWAFCWLSGLIRALILGPSHLHRPLRADYLVLQPRWAIRAATST